MRATQDFAALPTEEQRQHVLSDIQYAASMARCVAAAASDAWPSFESFEVLAVARYFTRDMAEYLAECDRCEAQKDAAPVA